MISITNHLYPIPVEVPPPCGSKKKKKYHLRPSLRLSLSLSLNMAAVLELLPPPPLSAVCHRLTMASPSPGVASSSHRLTAFRNSRGSSRRRPSFSCKAQTVSVLGIRFRSSLASHTLFYTIFYLEAVL